MTAHPSFGQLERDLAQKATRDALASLERTLALCETSQQRFAIQVFVAAAMHSIAGAGFLEAYPDGVARAPEDIGREIMQFDVTEEGLTFGARIGAHV